MLSLLNSCCEFLIRRCVLNSQAGGVSPRLCILAAHTPKHGESLTSGSKNPLLEALVHLAFPIGFFRTPALFEIRAYQTHCELPDQPPSKALHSVELQLQDDLPPQPPS